MGSHTERDAPVPDVEALITEDDTPVDSLFQEKQMRLLVEPLYSSWEPRDAAGEARPFVVAADVGIFGSVHERAIVPDVLLSMDVSVPDAFWEKSKRSYYSWEFGKMPELVIEIVSNREGDELEGKRVAYSKLRVAHYVVYDHLHLYGDESLRVFELRGDLLVPSDSRAFPSLGLRLGEWNGAFETKQARWLRWFDECGALLPTGAERAEQEAQRAEQEAQRAEQEAQRAEQEAQRAERLAAQLRKLGVEPE